MHVSLFSYIVEDLQQIALQIDNLAVISDPWSQLPTTQ